METKKLFLNECHLAGAMYHDLDEVFETMKVGDRLELVRDADNRFDRNAVAVMYPRDDEQVLIGYLPRSENETIAQLLEMGWGKIFKCSVSKINRDAHYEEQVHLKISIVRNEEKTTKKR